MLDKRANLKKKDELWNLEVKIAELCEEENRQKVVENFKEMDGGNGNLNHQGVWKTKRKIFPKVKPTLPVGKKNLKKQIITNPEDLKELYLDTFKFRLRHRPSKPGFEDLLNKQEELFKLRLDSAKLQRTSPWKMSDLETALKSLKVGKCRDPEGILREIFKEGILGQNLKQSMLILYNKIKETGKLPELLRTTNISAIYKGRVKCLIWILTEGYSLSVFSEPC